MSPRPFWGRGHSFGTPVASRSPQEEVYFWKAPGQSDRY